MAAMRTNPASSACSSGRVQCAHMCLYTNIMVTGAFVSTQLPRAQTCVQVCISYERKPLNPAWTIQSEPWHVLRMMSQLWTTAYVNILPMYEPSDAERQDAQLYADSVRTVMVRIFDTVACDSFSIPDKLFYVLVWAI